MKLDVGKAAEEVFDGCTAAIKEIDPLTNEDEWALAWEYLTIYKTYRENKAHSHEREVLE